MNEPVAVGESRSAVAAARQCVADLETRREIAASALHKLTDERRLLSFAAKTGDAAAQRELDRLAEERRIAATEHEDLGNALDGARARLAVAERHLADATAQARLEQAREISIGLIAASREFDEAAERMVGALRRREQLRRALVKTGAIDEAVTNRLLRPGRVNRALCCAGVGEFAEISRTTVSNRVPLAQADAQVVGSIQRPSIAMAAARTPGGM